MPITYNSNHKMLVIRTEKSAYAVQVNPDGYLSNLYWGPMISRDNDFPVSDVRYGRCGARISARRIREEYSCWGGIFSEEPCIKVLYPDNVRDVEAVYVSHSISEDKMSAVITLKDIAYDLYIDLCYKIYTGLDIIDRHAVIRNRMDKPVKLENAASAVWYMPDDLIDYRLTYMTSRWGREYDIQRIEVPTGGKFVIDSRSGVSNSHMYPYFGLDEGSATERDGKYWFGTLQWSVNHKITVENDDFIGITRVTGGINDFDFDWQLDPGCEFETPIFTCGFTERGFGGASRMLHDYQRLYINPRAYAEKPLPVIYNSWCAFEFDVDAAKIGELAEIAAKIGVELFVIDDGWFGTRTSDKAGLGDWYPDPNRFPEGLGPVIKQVNDLGMMFGIWVEPEMVNPDSELYRAHPDWVISFPTRNRELSRSQCILNIARDDVKEFIIGFLDKLLSENNIGYLKWDMNRFVSQPGWDSVPECRQRGFWYTYGKNLHDIFRYINEKFPDVIVENCASGGLRADLAMTNYCSRLNRSDNQDPLDELYLHEGFTYVNRSRSAGGAGHIGADGYGINRRFAPLEYRARIGMMGSLGMSLDLRKCDEERLAKLTEFVRIYKELRQTVQTGDLYRLVSAREDDYCAYEFVSRDGSEAVVFIFGKSMNYQRSFPRLKLDGLDPAAEYSVEGYRDMSGEGLMNIGLRFSLRGDFDSKLIRIKRK